VNNAAGLALIVVDGDINTLYFWGSKTVYISHTKA